MNFIFIGVAILAGAVVPFIFGIYKDAKEKMGDLDKSIKEHDDYIRDREFMRTSKIEEKKQKGEAIVQQHASA